MYPSIRYAEGMTKSAPSSPLHPLAVFCILLFPSSLHAAYPSFKPADIILHNCGASSDAIDANNRLWTNDSVALFSPSSSLAANATKLDTYLPSQIPYRTGRIFTSNGSFRFSNLSIGRHFVRLYFYPASYSTFNPNNAFFSIRTGPYTLLANYSPAIAATAENQSFVILEFFITIPPSGSLTLNFSPSPATPNSFAFINGIEIVSSPQLFFSGAFNSSNIVGSSQKFPLYDSDALQTVVRLNAGGAYISPTNDSGIFRAWYPDNRYIFGAASGVSYSADRNVTIRYSYAVPDYIAPRDVYATARSMGPSLSVNKNYNLTWLIPIDNGFRYLVRLHFCEIQSDISKINQREFHVYINNMIMEKSPMDVIGYAQRKVNTPPYTGVAVYRDYMVNVIKQSSNQSDLRVELHPNEKSLSQYADGIINGLEVFKINASSGNLAGPNPTLPPPRPPENKPTQSDRGVARSRIIVGALSGTAAAFVVIISCFCCVLWARQQMSDRKGSNGGEQITDRSNSIIKHTINKTKNVFRRNFSHIPSKNFTVTEIMAATNNFDDALLLGVGGFGNVYKGEIKRNNTTTTQVAIKRGSKLSQQGIREFQNEIELLSRLRHHHLVSLIGYCGDSSEMILVYDYMANGTLREHLYDANKPPLSWRQRLEICIGAAKGLHYLHTGAKQTIIHRDIKSTNILLDEKWVAKVADFGLSRMYAAVDATHATTMVKGTFGYFDPEYFRLCRLTEKSDVYSFGVVMLEVLCARPMVDRSLPTEETGLAGWALRCRRDGRLQQIVDPCLRGKIAPKCFEKFVETAEKCLADRGVKRPSMANVLRDLELALNLQLHAEEAQIEKGMDVAFVNDFGSEPSSPHNGNN